MALGAVTTLPINPAGGLGAEVVSGLRMTVTTVVMDSSYPTGGSVLTPAQLGLSSVLFSNDQLVAQGAGGIAEINYNQTTGKLQAFTSAAEVANATNLSANTAQIQAYGY